MSESDRDNIRRLTESCDEREDRRIREIDALRLRGLATWEDEREYRQIKRRRVIASVR